MMMDCESLQLNHCRILIAIEVASRLSGPEGDSNGHALHMIAFQISLIRKYAGTGINTL
jgi:hypothetical protein